MLGVSPPMKPLAEMITEARLVARLFPPEMPTSAARAGNNAAAANATADRIETFFFRNFIVFSVQFLSKSEIGYGVYGAENINNCSYLPAHRTIDGSSPSG